MNKIEKAQILMKEKNWELANELWEQVREESPDKLVGFISGGISLKRMKKYDKALELFDYAIKFHTNKINSKIQKANILMDLKRWKIANKLWEEIRVESPNNIVGFIRGAIVLQKMKEDDKAIEIFDYVIENYFDKIDTKIKI